MERMQKIGKGVGSLLSAVSFLISSQAVRMTCFNACAYYVCASHARNATAEQRYRMSGKGLVEEKMVNPHPLFTW